MIKDYSQLLSICIPTYNRAEKLESALQLWVEKVSSYNILICVSDNASEDNTKEVVARFQERYPHISYHRHDENIGPDKNFCKALSMSNARYRWLMGDDDKVSEGLDNLLDVLDQNYDVVLLNYPRLIQHEKSEIYDDKNQLMFDLGASTTFMSSLVFHERVVESDIFAQVYDSQIAQHLFAHSAALFCYLAQEGGQVFFLHNFQVESLSNGPVGWRDKAFHYFINELNETVNLLPNFYTARSKRAYVRKIRTHHFGIKAYYSYALSAKYAGRFSFKYFTKSHKNIRKVFTIFQRFVLFHIALWPKFFIKFQVAMMRGIYRFFKYTIRGKKHPSKIQQKQELTHSDDEQPE